MNTHYDHPYNFSELLQRYIDGEMTRKEQSALFDAMRDNPALQSELRSMMAVNTMLQSAKDVAPPALRSSVLNAVAALTTPAVVPTVTASIATTALPKVAARIPWLTALTGLAIGTAFTWFAMQSWNTNQRLTEEIKHLKNSVHSEQSTMPTTHVNTDNNEDEYERRIAGLEQNVRGMQQQNRRLIHMLHDMTQLAEKQQTSIMQQSTELIHAQAGISANTSTAITSAPSMISVSPLLVESVRTVSQQVLREIPFVLPQPQTTIANTTEQHGFSLDVRSYGMQSYPTVNVASLVSPPLNNIALGLRKNLTPEHSIGVEIGQENVLQRYTTEQGGTLVSIDQNYLALWGGFAYQYTPQSFFGQDLVLPYTRGVAGGTAMGPLFRGQVGITVPIMDGMRIALAAEAASFFYSQNSAWFSTNKLGWSLGFGFGF